MVFMCCLCKCVSTLEPRRSFHPFPEQQTLRSTWLRISKRAEGNLGKKTSICSLHFPKSSYNFNKGQRELKDDAVPTLHLDQKLGKANKIRYKSIVKKNLKIAVSKCAKCNRKFPSAAALKSHIFRNHGKRSAFPLEKRLTRKSEKTMERAKPLRTYGTPSKNVVRTDTEADAKPTKHDNRTKFECPKCSKSFKVYFPALKHIQKFHCVDKDGKEVPPMSEDLMKPISIEHCIICANDYRSTEAHNCLKTEIPKEQYLCLGCDQVFEGLSLYEVHLENLHGSKQESFYFQDSNEFTTWKLNVENQTKSKYIKLNENTRRQMYYCTYQPVTTDNKITTTQLCPSSIVVKKLARGTQVTYYGAHSRHPSEEYKVPLKYAGKCINHYLKEIEEMEAMQEDDQDLYVQFKKLMNSVVLDAAKLNISTLNILSEKAFEMTMILNGYDEDAEPLVQGSGMTETQVANVLTDDADNKKKRKQDFDVKLENNENVNKVNGDSPLKKLLEETPSSFNDSYKNFVSSVIKPGALKKKEVVKTRMGQFKPSPPKKTSVNMESHKSVLSGNKKDPLARKMVKRNAKDDNIWKVKPDTEYEIIEQENDCNILVLKI